MNASGKVDRKALALREPSAGETRGGGEPATPLERRIAAVWSDLLGQPRIGRDDDFFALGGHSLLATRVVSRLRAVVGPRFPIIGVGGIMSAEDAVSKIRAGADIVQIYTGLIYRGPQLVTEAARAIRQLRTADA